MRKTDKYILVALLIFCFHYSWAQPDTKLSNIDLSVIKPELEKVLFFFDSTFQPVLIKGTMWVKDGSDSTQNMPNTTFLLARDEGQLYYKMGNSETYNNSKAYVFIDHAARHALIGRSRAVISPVTGGLNQLGEFLESQQYTVSVVEKGNEKEVSFLNENHVTCKEYTILYDLKTFAPRKIFVRLTNLSEPHNKGADKRITLLFMEWKRELPPGIFNFGKVLEKASGAWHSKGALANYKLTVLQN